MSYSNKCLNCNSEIPDNKIYCDYLCMQGFRNRMFKEFNDNFKRSLE